MVTSGSQSGSQSIEIGGNTQLDQVITLAGHQITGIDEVWLDDEQVLFGASPDPKWSTQIYNPDRNTYRVADHKVYVELNNGAAGNPALATLIARTTKWTSAHKQSGRAHLLLTLVSDAVLFPDGMPDATFTVRGKPVIDLQTLIPSYTDNAARIIADYLTDSVYGLGYDYDDIELDTGASGSLS